MVDELKELWIRGTLTYDASRKQNFMMKACLMWTVNDFPAYGMLSGWSTHGRLACPYCMEDTKAFWLKYGRKHSWFDCHRRFLPKHHSFRRSKTAFKKNVVEKEGPPFIFDGELVWQTVKDLPQVMETITTLTIPGFGATHNWKKRSIFGTFHIGRTIC